MRLTTAQESENVRLVVYGLSTSTNPPGLIVYAVNVEAYIGRMSTPFRQSAEVSLAGLYEEVSTVKPLHRGLREHALNWTSKRNVRLSCALLSQSATMKGAANRGSF